MTKILNASFQEGSVPPQWKRAVVVPIPKNNPPKWNQLRPVSLTDHFAKVAESFITDWLMKDIDTQIDPEQFGNRKGRSTTHYLVKLVNNILKHAEHSKSLSRVIITDFSKAFDRVDHNIAIPKLLSMGARPSLIPWICSFLSNRSQCVRYQDTLSDWSILTGGVPQGTLDGPAIFLVLANDAALMNDENKLALKYVDDLTIVENTYVHKTSSIQDDLDRFNTWAEDNNMNLNPTKCMFMDVTFVRDPPVLSPLSLCDQDLMSTDIVKILGVKITKDLKWDVHIGDVIKRASGRLFMLSILKRFGLSIKDLVTVYVGFVRPLLEYAVPVWHPCLTQQQHDALERIQRRACRIIMGWSYTSYQESLLVCNISELGQRREKICLDFANSILNSNEFRNWLPNRRSVDTNYMSLRNSKQLSVPRSRTQRYSNSAIPYMVNILNQFINN